MPLRSAAPGWCLRRSGWSWQQGAGARPDLVVQVRYVTQRHTTGAAGCNILRVVACIDWQFLPGAAPVLVMNDNTQPCPTRCRHYPDRVLYKSDVALELRRCARTIDKMLAAGELPQHFLVGTQPAWMLHDLHDHISRGAGARCSEHPAQSLSVAPTGTKRGKAGKHSV